MTQTILANARLVLPEQILTGALILRNGAIAAIEEGAHIAPGAIDCGGDLVLPGLVERLSSCSARFRVSATRDSVTGWVMRNSGGMRS